MKKLSTDPLNLTIDALSVIPGRQVSMMKVTAPFERVQKLAKVGDIERHGKAAAILDRLYHEAGNDTEGAFLLVDNFEVRVYVSDRDGFKRIK